MAQIYRMWCLNNSEREYREASELCKKDTNSVTDTWELRHSENKSNIFHPRRNS